MQIYDVIFDEIIYLLKNPLNYITKTVKYQISKCNLLLKEINATYSLKILKLAFNV